jgi:glycosyltransferase involved in cell wall biosynthesis
LLDSPLAEEYELTSVSTVSQHTGSVRLMAFPLAIARLTWMFIISKPAAVHVHTASWGSFPRKRLVVGLAHLFGVPVILHIHGGAFARYLQQRSSREQAVRRTLQRCCVVIALSEQLKERLLALVPDADIRVIPNSVDIPVSPAHNTSSAHMIFVGRPVSEKGIYELLDAMSGIVEQYPAATLEIAGNDEGGGLASRLRDLALEGNVRMCGWLGSAALHEAYSRSSIFVLPSHIEAMPVSLLEAMSYGLACVATPVGAVPDIITDGDNGIIIPVNDSRALTAALKTLLADEQLRFDLGEHARATIIAHYSLARTADLIGGVYAVCGVKKGRAG